LSNRYTLLQHHSISHTRRAAEVQLFILNSPSFAANLRQHRAPLVFVVMLFYAGQTDHRVRASGLKTVEVRRVARSVIK